MPPVNVTINTPECNNINNNLGAQNLAPNNTNCTSMDNQMMAPIDTAIAMIDNTNNFGEAVPFNQASSCGGAPFTLVDIMKWFRNSLDFVRCWLCRIENQLALLWAAIIPNTNLPSAPSGVYAPGCAAGEKGIAPIAPSTYFGTDSTLPFATQTPVTDASWSSAASVIPGPFRTKVYNFPAFSFSALPACAPYRYEAEMVTQVDMTPTANFAWHRYFGAEAYLDGAATTGGIIAVSGGLFGENWSGPSVMTHGFYNIAPGVHTPSMRLLYSQPPGVANTSIWLANWRCQVRIRMVR